jgi:hypothetical protein
MPAKKRLMITTTIVQNTTALGTPEPGLVFMWCGEANGGACQGAACQSSAIFAATVMVPVEGPWPRPLPRVPRANAIDDIRQWSHPTRRLGIGSLPEQG